MHNIKIQRNSQKCDYMFKKDNKSLCIGQQQNAINLVAKRAPKVSFIRAIYSV